MARPITITKAIKKKVLSNVTKMLNDITAFDGTFDFSECFAYEDYNAIVWLTPEAHKKIVTLVTEFEDEVGWHGIASRLNDNEFIIEDIIVYPQEVTGCTVNTDQMDYTKWLYAFDDDVFSKIRMHGHSHCNMNVSPSGVDDNHRQKIVDLLKPDMFYIFMIWNKSLTTHTLIYDIKQNILYEDDDILVKVRGGDDMDAFLSDAKEKVQKKGYNKTGVIVQNAMQLRLHTSGVGFDD